MSAEYHQQRSGELGLPEGTGKRYSEKALNAFVDASVSLENLQKQKPLRMTKTYIKSIMISLGKEWASVEREWTNIKSTPYSTPEQAIVIKEQVLALREQIAIFEDKKKSIPKFVNTGSLMLKTKEKVPGSWKDPEVILDSLRVAWAQEVELPWSYEIFASNHYMPEVRSAGINIMHGFAPFPDCPRQSLYGDLKPDIRRQLYKI